MNRGTVRWLLLAPLLVYALGVVLVSRPPLEVASVVVAVATALPLVDTVSDRLGGWSYVPLSVAVAVLVFSVLGWAAPNLTAPLLLGLVLGSPLGFLGAYWRVRRAFVSAVVAYPLGAGLALIDVAIARGAAGPSAAGSAAAWMSAAHTIFQQQGESLGALGHGSAIPPASLAAVPDAGFAALVLLALVGLLVSWLLPPGDAGPAAPAGRAGPPLSTVRRRHLVSLGIAAGAVLAFEGAGLSTTPQIAIVGLCIAVAEMVVALAVASRWPSNPADRPTDAPLSAPSAAPAQR